MTIVKINYFVRPLESSTVRYKINAKTDAEAIDFIKQLPIRSAWKNGTIEKCTTTMGDKIEMKVEVLC